MKNIFTSRFAPASKNAAAGVPIFAEPMNLLVKVLSKVGLLTKDLDYHVVRGSMVIIYFFFGYQKWFPYEAQGLIPFITSGPLISWMYPVFGIQGASWFLGASEWLFGALLFVGFWNKQLGILGALGSCVTFVVTFTLWSPLQMIRLLESSSERADRLRQNSPFVSLLSDLGLK
jgi:uncharacterized membrane protein YkgB